MTNIEMNFSANGNSTQNNEIEVNSPSKQIIIDGVDVSGCAHYDKNADKEAPFLYDCKREHAPYWSCTSMPNCLYKKYKRKEQECETLASQLDFEVQKKECLEQECERLKNDKFALELRLDELTSPVNVEDCEHSVFNGEYIACRYYEGQRCDDADFANCMFRENVRLKQQLDQLKEQLDKLAEENEKLEKEKEDYCFDCDVAERMRKVTYAATGGRLSYANYTVEAIEQAYNDQLRIDVEYRTKELEEQLDQLKAENEELKKTVNDLLHKPEIQNKIFWKIDNEKLLLSKDTYIYKLEKTLQEIKELLLKTPTDSQEHCVNAKSIILQKIGEVEEQC